jgi:hypothetical protein
MHATRPWAGDVRAGEDWRENGKMSMTPWVLMTCNWPLQIFKDLELDLSYKHNLVYYKAYNIITDFLTYNKKIS